MRLIDADKLIYQSHAQHIQPYINKIDIDNAPTVEMAEDCISRQYLIERATSWDKHFADSERYVSLTDIQNASPVTPQPKRGKWIRLYKFSAIYECSVCHKQIPITDGFYEFYYCPNCGAKMDADRREVQDDNKIHQSMDT